MKQGDEVIYTIAVTGIKSFVAQSAIERELPKHSGPCEAKTSPKQIEVPRLYTFWRGDGAEKAWQNGLMEMIKEHGASCAIDVQPWTPAADYPQGDLSL